MRCRLILRKMSISTYLVDAFVRYAASSTAANTVLRSLFGGVLPLCGLKLYDNLGLGESNTLLAVIALVLVPIPWVIATREKKIRMSTRWQVKLD